MKERKAVHSSCKAEKLYRNLLSMCNLLPICLEDLERKNGKLWHKILGLGRVIAGMLLARIWAS